ncbi:MAG: amidohydrolase family protein [Acetobacteraceae bacterium]|nr:amidohydrolase family protein [Acetobacteraceae bacterium]
MRIDAHHHLWQVARGDYFWLTPALASIYRDFSLADLSPFLTRHGVAATILVQAAPTEAETQFLLGVAERNPVIAGVVGWTDFAADDSPERIAALAANPLLVGLRPMVQDIADDDWLLRPDLAPAFAALIRHRLVFDALALPRHLTRVRRVTEIHPDLVVVLDHFGKPPIAAGELDPWREDVAALAARPNTLCKLSGLVTEARPDWQPDHLRPYVDHVLRCFGPDRVMWGSDWPVLNLAGDYDRWMEASSALLADVPEPGRQAIYGGTAARVYLSARGRRPSSPS